MNFQESRTAFLADRARHEMKGAYLGRVSAYLPDEWKTNFEMAMDAQPALFTDPSSAVPAMLTTLIDPKVYRVLFAANKAALILGEQRKGTWLDQTTMFPTAENTGEVSSYDDYSENGNAGANVIWPQRQSYLFRVMLEYGELEVERAGLGRLNWVTELQASAALVLNKFSNLTYFYGVNGLENYGLFNDPNLSAPITPALKAYGGTAWIVNNQIKATANEIYNDVLSLFSQLVAQSDGLIEGEDKMVLALSPGSAVALKATNSFNVQAGQLIKENFPGIRVETAVQYGLQSNANNQGQQAGNLVQLIAETTEGQETGYMAFNEKMRSHKLIAASSSYKQKQTAGTWGAVLRQPFAIAQMLGV